MNPDDNDTSLINNIEKCTNPDDNNTSFLDDIEKCVSRFINATNNNNNILSSASFSTFDLSNNKPTKKKKRVSFNAISSFFEKEKDTSEITVDKINNTYNVNLPSLAKNSTSDILYNYSLSRISKKPIPKSISYDSGLSLLPNTNTTLPTENTPMIVKSTSYDSGLSLLSNTPQKTNPKVYKDSTIFQNKETKQKYNSMIKEDTYKNFLTDIRAPICIKPKKMMKTNYKMRIIPIININYEKYRNSKKTYIEK